MLKILQARLQQYMNRELPDVQAGFRKRRGTRDQVASICWIMEKAREFQRTIYFCFIDYAKAFDCVDHSKLENSDRDGNTRPPDLPLEKSVFRSASNSSEKAMAPHSSTLAWKIPWTEEPGRLQSMRSRRVGQDWATSLSLFTFHFHALEKEMATHFSILAWRIPRTGEPSGLLSMGLHRVGHEWSDLAASNG